MKPALQVAFLTGQSRPSSCALSPAQRRFLGRLAHATGAVAVGGNFPYWAETPPWRAMSLPRASLNNLTHYLGARGPAFRARHRASVLSLIAAAEQTIFLAGSCGLELLRRLDLPDEALARVAFVAFGPVARSRPACAGIVVQGRRDWVSRPFAVQPDFRVACGHLGYLEDDDFARICADFVSQQRERRAVSHAAAF